jgi:quinol monooxygenase YgiN
LALQRLLSPSAIFTLCWAVVRKVIEFLTASQDRARREPGCRVYTFAEAVDGPGHCVGTQEWRDATTFAAHYSSQPLAQYRRRVGEFLARRLHDVAKTVHSSGPGPDRSQAGGKGVGGDVPTAAATANSHALGSGRGWVDTRSGTLVTDRAPGVGLGRKTSWPPGHECAVLV